ncbi:MAG: hypothetical protein ABFD53_05130, partial [Anaerolineaceae bacterium]
MRAGWRLLTQSILFYGMWLIFELLLILYQGSSYSGFSLLNQVTSFLAITLSVFISRKLLDRRSIK